jgi:hypothetical protein
MNQSDINNYNNRLSNTKINYSNKLWLGITNNILDNNITNNITNNILDNNILDNNNNINEKLKKELNERRYNFSINN